MSKLPRNNVISTPKATSSIIHDPDVTPNRRQDDEIQDSRRAQVLLTLEHVVTVDSRRSSGRFLSLIIYDLDVIAGRREKRRY